MGDFIGEQIFFLVALFLVLWLPGRAWVRFLERRSAFLSAHERLAVSVSLSIASVDGVMLFLGRIGVPLTGVSVMVGIAAVSILFFGLMRRKKEASTVVATASKRTLPVAFFVVFSVALLVKMLYLVPNIVPSSTDLGHHMYWVKKIVAEEKLPVYEERDIEMDSGGRYVVGEPKSISDFIIGEHLTLSAIAMISGKSATSSFAIVTLFVIHAATLVSIYALARRLFERFSWAENVGVLGLFFYGVLYALGQSQLRFIAGGVVGNTIGNLFIPVVFLLLLIALRQRHIGAFLTSLILMFALAYTHHLSTLVLGLALVGTLVALAIVRRSMYRTILSLVWRREVLAVFAAFGLFFFFVYMPAYVRNAAVESVVGSAQNEEHLGMDFLSFVNEVGESRAALVIAGVILFATSRKFRCTDAFALLFGWTIALAVVVLWPGFAHIDLPSARVANYLAPPLAILSGVAFWMLARRLKRRGGLTRFWTGVAVSLLALLVAYSGFMDDNKYLKFRSASREQTLELSRAAAYLSEDIPSNMTVMHDHINIPGDSWVKLAFMRDYNYPFYRALLFRYYRADDRQEKCTLYVVSDPDSEEAKKCERDLNVGAVLVDNQLGAGQFERSQSSSKVYADAFHSIYMINNAGVKVTE